MTPIKIMTMALDRVGLTIQSEIFKARARDYFNTEAKDIASRARWSWLFKSSTLATSDGTRNYQLASDVLEPLSFHDQTNDTTLAISTSERIDNADPAHDESGDPRLVVITGRNSSTGYWGVDLFPTPDAANTIGYRYYGYIENITVSDDNTDLAPTMPEWVQPALIHVIASQYYLEKGAERSARLESALKEDIVDRAIQRNTMVGGNMRTRMGRHENVRGPFDFMVQEGSIA